MPSAAIKKRIRIAIVIVLALAAVVFFVRRSLREKTPDNVLVLHGNIDIRQVDLAFNANERIDSVRVEEGDRVKAGQLLATLDKERLRHAAEQAASQVKAQEDVVAALVAGTRPEDIRRARAEAAAAEAEADNAGRTSQRLSRLVEKELISRQEADDAKAAADASRARLQAAKEALDLAIAGPRKEDIEAAKATLKALREALAVATQNLSCAELYAPSNGVIQSRILEPGDMASAQKPAFTLALTDPIWVRAYVSETDMGRIRPGMKAEVTTDSFPGKKYAAWIGFISPTAQFTPKSVETREVRTSLVYQARVFVDNPEDQLRLGMPATVTVPLDQAIQGPAQSDRQKRP
ncbi:MAG: efflux RND transporter periplasmic adaptor subunit [Nitrospiraceae bacterium]|nr:efflux RND transporter periplasmic adaptor subunit [Nitrospiraceae bacterium]